jgi:hypothetical protein
VLPLDGTLHVREPGEKRDQVLEPKAEATEATDAVTQFAAGGH